MKNINSLNKKIVNFVSKSVGIEDNYSINEIINTSKEATDSDVIIIGSSIIHLLKAIALASYGRKVIVIEGSEKLGGVWSTIDILGLKNIERATHIFMPCETTYNLFEQFFEHPFINIDPKPFSMIFKKNEILEATKDFPGSEESPNPSVKYQGPCKEPLNGPNSLVSKLVSISKELGVVFITNTYVSSIDCGNKYVTLNTKTKKLKTKKVIISRGSPIAEIKTENSNIIPFNSSNNISIHFITNKGNNFPFSFIHFQNHPLIVELQDLTNITNGIDQNHKFFVCKLKYNIFNSEKVSIIDTSDLFKSLIKSEIFSSKTSLIKTNITGYAQTRLNEKTVKNISNRFSERIEILPFTSIDSNSNYTSIAAQDISVAISSKEFLKNLVKNF